MAIAFVISRKEQIGSGSWTSTAVDTTGATLLVVVFSYWRSGGGTPTLTDSKSNTWTSLTMEPSSNHGVVAFYATNVTVGSGHTFSQGASNVYASMWMGAFSGTHLTAPLDQEAAGGSGTGTSGQPGSITPSVDGCLLLPTLVLGNYAGSPSIDSSFTVYESADYVPWSTGGGGAYLIQGTAAAVNPTWSWTNSIDYAVGMACFLPPSGGTSVVPVLMRQYRARRV